MPIGFVTVSSDASDWLRRLQASGRNVKQYSHTAVKQGTPALWVVVVNDVQVLHDGCSWLDSLNGPVLLITPHLAAAYALHTSIRHLSIICHPSRAAVFLEDMLVMTMSGAGGVAVFGPFRPRVFDRTHPVFVRR